LGKIEYKITHKPKDIMKKPTLRKTIVQIALALCLIGVLIPTLTVSAARNALSEGQTNGEIVSLPKQQAPEQIVVYFFWGDGCPHCAKAKPFLAELSQSNPRIKIMAFEVWKDKANLELFRTFGKGFGFEIKSVPTIFIGDKYWEGYSDFIKQDIQTTVDQFMVSGYIDKGAQFLDGTVGSPPPTPEVTPNVVATQEPISGKVIKVPFFGNVDISRQSLLISTLLISFVDGFNPCSIWVLSMLLAITLHTGSRKKVLIIGLVFLTVTAAIYALFIAGLFTVFTVVSFVGWIQVVVALVALFFALVNIKDYFWYKEGISFTIDDKKKPGLYQKIRKVMDAGDSFWGLVGGTIVLSAGVSLVEFSCTAGFPVLWTNLLTAQNVSVLTFILLLLVYMFIYQIDELGIFLVAVFTLKASKIEEKHGRILKLIGGVLMLTLAGVMLIKPSLMSDLGQSMIVFGIAFAVTLVILIVHRVILPRLGVKIGSELSDGKKKK
jgi:thiol-disulfide isomerase/thioredoxin